MTRKIRAAAAIALIGATALTAAGCSAGGNAAEQQREGLDDLLAQLDHRARQGLLGETRSRPSRRPTRT